MEFLVSSRLMYQYLKGLKLDRIKNQNFKLKVICREDYLEVSNMKGMLSIASRGWDEKTTTIGQLNQLLKLLKLLPEQPINVRFSDSGRHIYIKEVCL